MLALQKNSTTKELSSVSKKLIRTLAYYDIFNYPLTIQEIFHNTYTNGDSFHSFVDEIKDLESKGIIHRQDRYYTLFNNLEFIPRRIAGNNRAVKKLKTAKCFSNIIAKFPFVRAVFVSGSLSKGYMDEDADIDFFVITKPNRLWISRFLLMLFKKVFLLNSKKNFCINYFISTKNLEIENRNIYTAIELASMLPMYGADIYRRMYDLNSWIDDYVPNYPKRELQYVNDFEHKLTQKILEPILDNFIGDKIDDLCMKLFYYYDKKRYKNFDEDSFKRSFIFKKNTSTHHPESFQTKVLRALEQKISHLQVEHNILLN